MNKSIVNNVHKPKPVPQRVGWRWLLLIGILFCELTGHVWIRTETTHAMIRTSEAEKQLAMKQNYNKALAIEVDRLKSEARIRRIAINKLHLIRDLGANTFYLPGASDNG